jgi:RimJ/RimL family protein N-acetyltransferase
MRIETGRLALRELRETDEPDLHACWADPRYQRFYPEIEDVAQAVRALLGRLIAARSEQPRRTWQLAITLRGHDRLIGNCGIRVNDPARREANIGYELHPDHWGRGYATEAARAILGFGFSSLEMHRVWAECVADNTASAHVLEKLGMRREAHLREHQWYRTRWWDTLIYAILDREWQEVCVDDQCLSPALSRARASSR